ncbi:MAG TPA: VWA domain-containing protein [Bryobacteraceae bacterium]|jgi:VWFA-related protein|nr:VWA domain-containing protein [Bryobacteraceae bacterium]
MMVLFLALLPIMAVAQDTGPSFRATTRVVEVSVVATRSGDKPVDDLRPGELRLFDNNQEQTIVSFEKRGSPGQGPVDADSPPPSRVLQKRPCIIVLDALNTAWSDQNYGREGVLRMLETLPPGDHIAIFALGDRLRLLHDFSTDYAALRNSVTSYNGELPSGGDQDSSAAQDPNSAQFRIPGQVVAPMAGLAPDAVFYQEQRIRNTLNALTLISDTVKRFAGEKELLWVSAAFPLEVRTNMGGQPQEESFHEDVERAMREVTNANIVLYPIDPRGVLGSFDIARTSTMEELAEQTGGRAWYGDNDVSYLIRAAMGDSRHGYLLTYTPKTYGEDGSFHQIRLKTSRKGVRLRYRVGYIAEAPSMLTRPREHRKDPR